MALSLAGSLHICFGWPAVSEIRRHYHPAPLPSGTYMHGSHPARYKGGNFLVAPDLRDGRPPEEPGPERSNPKGAAGDEAGANTGVGAQ